MKKVALFLLLTSVVLAHFANYLILSSHLSETSKVICLILSSFVFSSVALQAILVLLGLWSTIRTLDGSNHLATLAMKEKEILSTKEKRIGTLTSDRILDDFPDEDPRFRWRVPF